MTQRTDGSMDSESRAGDGSPNPASASGQGEGAARGAEAGSSAGSVDVRAGAPTTSFAPPAAPPVQAWEWFRSTTEPRAGVISGVTFDTKVVHYSELGGMAVVEGDVVVGTVAEVAAASQSVDPDTIPVRGTARGVVVVGDRFRWPNAVVPYEVDPTLPNQQRVTDAIQHWETNTHLRFPRRTAANQAQFPNYIRFVARDGCWSHVGMQGGMQEISLAGGCGFGAAVHEIGHAVGLWHEQSREDRTRFVRVVWENITPGMEHNFNQHITDGDDVGRYDFGSIMHYGPTAFSRNGQPTIVTLGGQTIGQRGGLSAGDIAAVEAIYPRLISPRLTPRAAVNVVSRSADKLDVFATDRNGVVFTAAWEPGFRDGWHGWWTIRGGRAAPGAPVHVVSRSADKLDVFVTGTDNRVFTAAWEPAFADGWHGWWALNGGVASPGAHVTAVSRSRDKLDVFVVGTDGHVYTAAWEPGPGGWRGWWRIGAVRLPAGAPIHAVSRGPDKLDLFVTDVNGVVQTAAWEPAFSDGWHGWWALNGGRAAPGAPVTAVSRSRDKLDVFVVGMDGHVYTAAWEPGPGGWRGWWRIGAVRAPAGAPVHAVSRAPDKLDVFVTDAAGAVQTAAWEPAFSDGWHGWWALNGGRAAPGAPVTAVSRSRDKLDVFVVGTDNRVFTAAWEPGAGWRGWWALGA